MGTRRSFRPSGHETLEARLVLSAGGGTISVTYHALPTVLNTPSRLGPIGALGDSYSDEYRFYAPDRTHARNWVEMLHTLREVSFGPYTTLSRGVPRSQGFAYNWAQSSATSTTMVQNQLPGLAAQVAKGQVRYASIFIGGNDFFGFASAAKTGQIPPANLQAALTQTTTQLISNVATAVDTLLAANPNVRVVVWTLPDISLTPIAQQAAAGNPAGAALLQGISQATAQFNAFIHSLNASPRVAVADLATLTNQAVASSTNGTITFGGQSINLVVPGDDYHNFFLADGLHAGTVAQGIIADTFVEAIDAKYGEQLFPVTPQEIIRYAQRVQTTSAHPRGPQLY